MNSSLLIFFSLLYSCTRVFFSEDGIQRSSLLLLGFYYWCRWATDPSEFLPHVCAHWSCLLAARITSVSTASLFALRAQAARVLLVVCARTSLSLNLSQVPPHLSLLTASLLHQISSLPRPNAFIVHILRTEIPLRSPSEAFLHSQIQSHLTQTS